MSTRPTPSISTPQSEFVRLPDAPFPDDVNNWLYLNSLGNGLYLTRYLGNEDTTLITSEAFISPEPTSRHRGLFAPDLLVAFRVDPDLAHRRNGYVISDHGKPPDFVLEIGSPTTGRRDATVKRDGYARLGVPEYWRFDPSGGDYQGAPLAGDALAAGAYEPIPITQIDDETYQGYSTVLNLHLRWESGRLGWYDPATGRHIPTFDDERARAEHERVRAIYESARADDAEAKVRELEAELERRQQGQ